MMFKRWVPILGAALLATSSQAQKASEWRVYKAADGMPETVVSSVAVGNRGTVWVKHLNSPLLSSLNGYGIKTIPSPGVGANRFYESPSGQVWTIAPEGLQQFTDDHWVQYTIPEISAELHRNTLNLVRPVPLYPLRQNHVLFVVGDGLMEFNVEKSEHPQTSVLLPANRTHVGKFSSLAASRDGGLWITAVGGLVHIIGPARNLKPDADWKEFPMGNDKSFHNLREPVEDDDGGVTALADATDGDKTVIVHFDGKKWSSQLIHLEKATHAWHGINLMLWATTGYSLLQIKENQTEFSLYDEISAQHYFDVAIEPRDVFWLATSEGLFRHAPLTWRSPRGNEEINTHIDSIVEDQDGSLWVASVNAVHQFKGEHWKSYACPQEAGVDTQIGRTLFVLPDGTIALASGEQLMQFNPAIENFQQLPDTKNDRFKTLGALKDGRLVVEILNPRTPESQHQLRIYDGKKFSNFPYDLGELNLGSELLFIFAAQNGHLWLCGNKGMGWYHDKTWELSGPFDTTIAEGPTCMTEVSDGKIWCGVQGKIWEFDGKTWHILQAGFDRINSFVRAHDGSVWIGTEGGMHRFHQRAWIANTEEEGLPSASVHQVYEDSAGRIWAGTTRGLSLYHPESDPDPPQTFVHDLPESKNNLSEGALVNITFGAQDKWKYTPRERLLFSYRLDQKEWTPYQDEKSAVFSDLPPGKHYFQVRSIDRNWNVDPKPARLEFVIALPWYKESRLLWIGSAGIGFALFFAGLAFNRHWRLVKSYAEVEAQVALRTKQLEQANQELFHSQKMNALGTLAAGIAHDFNNILSIIKGSAQIIEENLDNHAKITTRTDRIKTVVEQGSGIVNAMLGFSRSSDQQLGMYDLNFIVEQTVQLLGDRFRREVKISFEPGKDLPQVPASKEFVQQILLNLIFNAAEAMTENRHIILSTIYLKTLPKSLALAPAVAAEYLAISVKDIGCGIAPEIMARIFEPFFTTKAFSARRGTGLGLSMVYELARQMDAGLSVDSTPGQGSTFTVIIPVRNLSVDAPAKKD